MNVYIINDGVLTYLKPQPFLLEKQMQKLIEDNLSRISGLELVKSEFRIKKNRIDTYAYNPRLNAFVVIEYKRDKNYSVIDQGIAYLKFMNEHKADFLVEYNTKTCSRLKISDIKWYNSYVIFAAPEFTAHQVNAAGYKNLKIILWLVKYYGGSVLSINEIANNIRAELGDPVPKIQSAGLRIPQSWQNEPLWNEIKMIGSEAGKSRKPRELFTG